MKILEREDNTGLRRISEAEALKLLEKGETVILQTNSRDYSKVENKLDISNTKRLFDMGIHKKFMLYAE